MKQSKNGVDYAQNYDFIVKWLSEAFCGETLEVLGIQTGRIEQVFGYEPVEITVKAERVDVIFKDELGAYYHLEEQRNMRRSDLFRFASYHFQVAEQWSNVTDIILASGKVFKGSKIIKTKSGKYKPTVIDLTERDGAKRLKEIRDAVESGNAENLLELVFVPLYGREHGRERSILAESVLRLELDLYKREKMSKKLVAATLIMSNKFVDKAILKQIWEEVEMLDIIEVAHEVAYERGVEYGIHQGKDLGLKEGKDLGKLEYAREMVLEAIEESFGIVPVKIADKVRDISNRDTLKSLHRQAIRCENIEKFEEMLNRV
ncbi:DUF4351 domain-containing protein [Candidatus Magnetomoraceae bacterium gMMP-15]